MWPAPFGPSRWAGSRAAREMNKDRSLRRKTEFLTVQRQGRWWSNPLLIIRVLPNPLGRSRFGFLVSRRVGNAVARNLVKRRLREIVRKEPIPEGWDVVLIARSGLSAATFNQATESVRELFRRSRITGGAGHSAGEASKANQPEPKVEQA